MEDLNDIVKDAFKKIDDKKVDINQVSQFILKHPELSEEETQAHEILTTFLDENGFEVERHFVLNTGFKAQYGTNEGPNIGLVCEYDALPGIGHACGHNLIAVSGIAAAIGIKEALVKSGIKGKVTVFGTPAEETIGGKMDFIKAKAFDGIDVGLMVHPSPFDAVKPGICCSFELYVTFHGKESHASGAPWDGVNAMDAAVLAYQGIAVMRQQMKPDCRYLVIIAHGKDSKPNIIPAKAHMEISVRAADTANLLDMKNKLTTILDGAASMTGCSVETDMDTWMDRNYESMLFNPVLCDLYKVNAENLGVVFLKADEQKVLGGTDMGNISRIIPSIHPVYSIYTAAANHTKEFTIAAGSQEAFEATIVQSKVLVKIALDLFINPELLKKVKITFNDQVEEEKRQIREKIKS